MSIYKIVIIGLGGALLAMIIRQFQKEYSVMILFSVCIFLLYYLTSNLSVLLTFFEKITGKIHYSSSYYQILLKLISIAYLCQTSSTLCEDLGYESISFQIETIGKINMIVLSIPILESLLSMIEQLF